MSNNSRNFGQLSSKASRFVNTTSRSMIDRTTNIMKTNNKQMNSSSTSTYTSTSVFSSIPSGLPTRVGPRGPHRDSATNNKRKEEEAALKALELCAALERRQYRDTALNKMEMTDDARDDPKGLEYFRKNRVERNYKLEQGANSLAGRMVRRSNSSQKEEFSFSKRVTRASSLPSVIARQTSDRSNSHVASDLPEENLSIFDSLSQQAKQDDIPTKRRNSLLGTVMRRKEKQGKNDYIQSSNKENDGTGGKGVMDFYDTTPTATSSARQRISEARMKKREMERRFAASLGRAIKSPTRRSNSITTTTTTTTDSTMSNSFSSKETTYDVGTQMATHIPEDDLLGFGVTTRRTPRKAQTIAAADEVISQNNLNRTTTSNRRLNIGDGSNSGGWPGRDGSGGGGGEDMDFLGLQTKSSGHYNPYVASPAAAATTTTSRMQTNQRRTSAGAARRNVNKRATDIDWLSDINDGSAQPHLVDYIRLA
uniref:Uncharacterized protein n=1 Tax=Ditylum brightwellii TaxID=49249 RepID=A0A7S4RJ17_9STRA